MTFGEKIHGMKPEVADFIPTDPIEQLKKMLAGETGAFPQITGLSDLYQKYMMSALDQAIPGFSDLFKTGGEDTQALLGRAGQFLTGDLPPDVMSDVFRQSAFQNIGSGLWGSPGGSANQARQLGISKLDLINKGAGLLESGTNAAQRWAQIASGTILNPAQQLYSPDWFSNFMATQNQLRQATKQLKYNTAAAPDPAWADRAKLFATLTGSFAGAQGAGNSMNSFGQNFSGMGAGMGGAAGAMGGPSGMMAGMYGGGTLGQGQANFGQPQNQGFLQNFWNSYNSTDPTNKGVGIGGGIGNWLGGIFNAGG
jgi:hypothetical protein